MFLRAQHFQQQDRWLEALVRTRTAPLRPHPWGIVEMAIDRELLATGRFALTSAIGMFEDGTPFAIPGETDHPPPLELPESTRNAVVYLADQFIGRNRDDCKRPDPFVLDRILPVLP